MEKTIFLGQGRQILAISSAQWEQSLGMVPQQSFSRLSFMTEPHHRIRYYAVSELAKGQKPLTVERISTALEIPVKKVETILQELEQKLFFLVRNRAGEVVWAYPFTAEPTAYSLEFSTGERSFAAWAEDAIASSFVQGQLLQKKLAAQISTVCKHCGQSLNITIDSELNFSVHEASAAPLVFLPDVAWDTFSEPNIIHSYWMNSLFFWSEEHAKDYRENVPLVNGIYITLEQAAYMTPITQGALFAFNKNTGKNTR